MIPSATLQELYRKCGENTDTVVEVLTADQHKSTAKGTDLSRSSVIGAEREGEEEQQDDINVNRRCLCSIFPPIFSFY